VLWGTSYWIGLKAIHIGAIHSERQSGMRIDTDLGLLYLGWSTDFIKPGKQAEYEREDYEPHSSPRWEGDWRLSTNNVSEFRTWSGSVRGLSTFKFLSHEELPFYPKDPWVRRSAHTILVPLWVLTLASGLLPAIRGLQMWLAKRRKVPGHCPVCSYNLTGNLSGACPECGTAKKLKVEIVA
jgi:hypothetical protein